MPPHSTRNCGVISFPTKIPLFIQPISTDFMLDRILDAVNATPRYQVSLVSATHTHKQLSSHLHLLQVRFWTEDEEKFVYSLEVPVPKNWTAELYLGVLQHSIGVNNLLSIENWKSNGSVEYLSINEVHNYFHMSVDELENEVSLSGLYYNVRGGIRIK